MSHWSDPSDNWLESFKRKLQFNHKDLAVYLDLVIENTDLEFINVQACALSAAKASDNTILSLAIGQELKLAREKTAAEVAASMAALNKSWISYCNITQTRDPFLNSTSVLVPYGGVSELKFNMYLLSASIVYCDHNEIQRLSEKLKKDLTNKQITDIARIASIIHAVSKSQI